MKSTPQDSGQFIRRNIRNRVFFGSLLLDRRNQALRVFDFRSGDYRAKHSFFLKGFNSGELRKIFLLAEKDEARNWQAIGYQAEGTIPGYFGLTDAQITGHFLDERYAEELPVPVLQTDGHKKQLAAIRLSAEALATSRLPTIECVEVNEDLVFRAVREEAQSLVANKGQKKKNSRQHARPSPGFLEPFGRDSERLYFSCKNNRTKRFNIVSAEIQDCFGNSRLQFCFPPALKTEQAMCVACLEKVVDLMTGMGIKTVFSLVRSDDLPLSAVFAHAGFRCTARLREQLLTDDGPKDQLIWSLRLV